MESSRLIQVLVDRMKKKQPVLIAASYTVTKTEQPACPSIDEWVKKTHTPWVVFSHKKKQILPFVTACMFLEGIMLSEIS